MRDLKLIFLESEPNITNLMLQGKKQGVEGTDVTVIFNSH